MSLDLSGITRAVGAEIHIRDVSMRLERGSVNVLLGPTRAGKTSLMRLMAGLDMPTGGTMTLDGRDITRVPVRGRNVAMVYQQFINYPALTVYENIASPLRIQKKSTRDIDEAVHTAAALMKLEAHLQKTPLQLSGGQQQRTAIARALVKKADVVLLDEPLANLDYKLREELRVELPRIFESTGAIFVYATTEPAEALLLGGKTATMAEGRVTQFGAAADVYRHPHDRETAELYSDPPMNFVEAIVASGKIKIAGQPEFAIAGALKTLADGTYVLGFRPHHLSLKVAGEDHYAFETVVAVAELSGSESFVHVDAGPSRWIALAHGVHDVLPGAPLQVSLDPDRLFVFDPSGALRAAPRRQEG